MSIEIPWYYRGESLKEAVFSTPEYRHCLVDSIIAEHSVTMLYAADGVGKSTLALQLALQAASGVPVFGGFDVLRPITVIYIMAERHRNEILERIRAMSGSFPILWNNIAITDSFQGINIANSKDRNTFVNTVISEIANKFPIVDLIVIDPIYALLPEGLKDEIGASAVGAVNRAFQKCLGCSMLLVHHATKGIINQETMVRSGRDMYGHSFLSNQISGKFHITPHGNTGTTFKKQKDTFGCLSSGFSLIYDEETYLSTVEDRYFARTKKERGLAFLRAKFLDKNTFTIKDLMSASTHSLARCREQVGEQVNLGNAINLNPVGTKGLYKMLKAP